MHWDSQISSSCYSIYIFFNPFISWIHTLLIFFFYIAAITAHFLSLTSWLFSSCLPSSGTNKLTAQTKNYGAGQIETKRGCLESQAQIRPTLNDPLPILENFLFNLFNFSFPFFFFMNNANYHVRVLPHLQKTSTWYEVTPSGVGSRLPGTWGTKTEKKASNLGCGAFLAQRVKWRGPQWLSVHAHAIYR